MKTLIILAMLLFTPAIYAQYTAIPDPYFEYALIQEGHDDVMDGQVLTANINTVTELNVSVWVIQDLTGIEAFTALEFLNVSDNELTALDVSNNHNLIFLDCAGNQLTAINISNNPNLLDLSCDDNQLTSLDITANPLLELLWCDVNNLTELDVSQNPNMYEIYCGDNPLSFINIQNGNNLELEAFNAENIFPNACIQVDDATGAASANSFPYDEWVVDNAASFSENCALATNEFIKETFAIFPNPARDFVSFKVQSNSKIEKLEIYSTAGILMESKIEDTDKLNISNLSAGLYLIKVLFDNGEIAIQKMIKE